MRMAKVLTFVALAVLLTAAAQSQTRKPTPRPAPKPSPTPLPNKPPSVKLVPSRNAVTLAPECDEGEPTDPMCQGTSPQVKLSARAEDPDGDTMLYTYSTTGGRINGEGPEVTLDLSDVLPGTYTVTIEVDDGNGGIATDSTKIEVSRCSCPLPVPKPPQCPTVKVNCPAVLLRDGTPVTFTADVFGSDKSVTPTYNWTVSAGTITSGQGTSSITVDIIDTTSWLTATVDVGGYDRSCPTSSSCTAGHGDPWPRKFDEYGNIRYGDERARLDNYAIELQNDPTAQGYVICYGGRRSAPSDARRRCERARNYLGNLRRISGDRIVTVEGGYREEPTVELWIVSAGATPPQPSPTVDPSEVKAPAQPRGVRRRVRR